MTKTPCIFSVEVHQALQTQRPIVALESAVITHGLPSPHNLLLAQQLEEEVRSQGAVPATIALLQGQIHVGLEEGELLALAHAPAPRKISRRDFGIATAQQLDGGTTVAGTLIVARLAGLRVFATGGIGGVHRGNVFDISADLPELGRSPLIVVCAGAKSILDLPATLEYLETQGVAIIGYQTDTFPAFYATSSGLPVDCRVDTPAEAAAIARAQWNLGIHSAVLVVTPPPAEAALPGDAIEAIISQALIEAEAQHIHGAALTPFLLGRVSQLSHGDSLQANLALLRNNARLAAQIAIALNN
jgi:pseudouridine-5'-phosphate glycosidase